MSNVITVENDQRPFVLVEKGIDSCLDFVYTKGERGLGRLAAIGGGEADIGPIDDHIVVERIDCYFELLEGLRTVLGSF